MEDKEGYTLEQIAKRTGFSRWTIAKMFEHEKGVLILKRPGTMHKRGYRSIRVPRAVYERVISRITVR